MSFTTVDLGGRRFPNENNLNFDKTGDFPNHRYIITGKLKVYFNDGDTDTIDDYEVRVKAKDLWLYRQGALMQDAFPYLQPMDREFLMTGTWLGNDLDDEEEDDTDDGSWEGR